MHTEVLSQSWHAIDLAAFPGFSSAISGVLLAEKHCPPSTKATVAADRRASPTCRTHGATSSQRWQHPSCLKLQLKSVLGILESPKNSTLFLTISRNFSKA